MNNSNSYLKVGLAATAVLSIAPTATDGSGFDLPDQDAFAVGRGLAVVATADDPSAIFFNPAGLTQLKGNNLRAGLYAIDLDTQFTPNGGGNTFHNQNRRGAACRNCITPTAAIRENSLLAWAFMRPPG